MFYIILRESEKIGTQILFCVQLRKAEWRYPTRLGGKPSRLYKCNYTDPLCIIALYSRLSPYTSFYPI